MFGRFDVHLPLYHEVQTKIINLYPTHFRLYKGIEVLPNGIGVSDAVATPEASPKSFKTHFSKESHCLHVELIRLVKGMNGYLCDKRCGKASFVFIIRWCIWANARNWIVNLRWPTTSCRRVHNFAKCFRIQSKSIFVWFSWRWTHPLGFNNDCWPMYY